MQSIITMNPMVIEADKNILNPFIRCGVKPLALVTNLNCAIKMPANPIRAVAEINIAVTNSIEC